MTQDVEISVDLELSEQLSSIDVSLHQIANAITPFDATPGTDETGGVVGSLTEAAMGITSGLFKIAEAIEHLAEATQRSHNNAN